MRACILAYSNVFVMEEKKLRIDCSAKSKELEVSCMQSARILNMQKAILQHQA